MSRSTVFPGRASALVDPASVPVDGRKRQTGVVGTSDRPSRWSDRFRARIDAAATGRAGSPQELYRRELDALAALMWAGVIITVGITLAVLIGGIPWWTSVLMLLVTVSFGLQLRLARRRGGPRPPLKRP